MRKLIFTLTLILLCNIGFSQNVIDPRLQEVLNQKGDEMIDINIVFKSQIDLGKLKTRAQHVSDKKVKRNILVDELKLFTEEKQQEVLSILKAETRGSKVTNIRTHWLSNAITCTASKEVIYLLAEHPDIEMIGWDERQQMVFDNSQQSTDNGQQLREEVDMTDNIKMVNADKVWEMGYTGKGVLVAVIDTGVNYNHADLADHLWDGGAEYPNHGYNTIDNNNDPMDRYGHGTHCAGTVCGDGTSGIHTGIAPDATLMCVKALDNNGSGTTSSINAAMEFAIENHADILSMSLGIIGASVTNKTILRNTCVNALELGVIASVAAGNFGTNMTPQIQIPNNINTPGDCPPPWLHPDQQENAGALSCVVSVGAIDFDKNMYENGSKGPVTWTNTEFNDYPYNPGIGLIRPDICAPGVGIKSLDYTNTYGYNLKTGTSMATPCVAGVMALMLEKQNDLTPAEICMTLETTAERFTETKSNLFGSGLVDAFKAVTNITKGSLSLNNIIINDSNFNNNAHINAGETVKISLNVHNDSEQEYNNLRAVVSCANDLITITDSTATIAKITANSDVILTDEFELSVNEGTNYKTSPYIEINFYDENEICIGTSGFLLEIKDNELVFASYIVKNDNNNNGILEAGETADLGVILNNVGNEIAVKVKGVLTNTDHSITINNNEAEFSSIGANSSAVAFFNVTLSENFGSVLSIPFELKTKDFYEKENTISCNNYINACNYIFQLEDSMYDGWDESAILVKYDNGNPTDTLTIPTGTYMYYEEYRLLIPSNVGITLEWHSVGEYDSECKFTVLNEFYQLIYSSPKFNNGVAEENIVLFSWINDCSCQNEAYSMCDAVQDLTSEPNNEGIELTWSAVSNHSSSIIKYEIYRGTGLLATTENTTFIDTDIVEDVDYIYSVRAVSDDCVGYFADVTAHYTPVMINENTFVRASVYPNPSNGDFTISCKDMTHVIIYNLVGNKIMEAEVNGSTYIINGLESGVYFVNIKTEEGNAVKRILKL